MDHAQAIQEVLAELTCGDPLGQIAIRRGDHADVEPSRAVVGTDLLDLTVLEEAQQERLHAQAHLADFVEEQRAPVRLLQLADLVAIRAGEAALHVTEQLRFEQGLGQAGAVDGDVRPLAPG